MRVLQGILLSLGFHFLLLWAAQYAVYLTPEKAHQPIIVEIQSPQNEKNREAEKQLVREAMAPEKEKIQESEDPLKFLSAQTQRVRKQTRALLAGMTKNRNADSLPQKDRQGQPAEKPTISENKIDKSKNSIDAFTPEYRKRPAIQKDLQADKGLSTFGEVLPQDVSVGSFTALNTDRYLYYSFFARIEELIRFRWENGVRIMIDSTPPDRFKANVSGLWKTNIEIWLRPTGEFHSAHIMKESGFKGFDQAAVQSFIQARMFPNPPQELVEADGMIRLKYAFQVHYEPKVLVKSRETSP